MRRCCLCATFERDSLGATEGEHEEQDGAHVLANHGDDVLCVSALPSRYDMYSMADAAVCFWCDHVK
jgi:hypothetical protein